MRGSLHLNNIMCYLMENLAEEKEKKQEAKKENNT